MTHRTATAADLAAVLKACVPGDVIAFTGALDVNALPAFDFADPGVTIEAASGARLAGYAARPLGSGLTFRGFTGANVCLWATAGGWLAVEDCRFVGRGAVAGGDGGLAMFGCVRTRRCTFSQLGTGISVQGGGGHLVEDCAFADVWKDAVSAKVDGALTLRRNRFTDFRGPPEHLDCIQVLANARHDGAPIVIEGNVYVRGSGTAAQGVFTDAAPAPLIVRGNAFLGGPWQTIAIYGAKVGTIVEGNFLQGWNVPLNAKGEIGEPWISVHGVDVGENVILKNTAGGDRSAMDAWLAGGPPLPSLPPPSPGPAPAPEPTPPPAPPAADPRDAVITALTAAGLDLVASLRAEMIADDAALRAILEAARAGRQLTSAATMRPVLDRIASLAAGV